MVSLINKQLLLTAYAYLFIMEQQKAQQGSEALQLQLEKSNFNGKLFGEFVGAMNEAADKQMEKDAKQEETVFYDLMKSDDQIRRDFIKSLHRGFSSKLGEEELGEKDLGNLLLEKGWTAVREMPGRHQVVVKMIARAKVAELFSKANDEQDADKIIQKAKEVEDALEEDFGAGSNLFKECRKEVVFAKVAAIFGKPVYQKPMNPDLWKKMMGDLHQISKSLAGDSSVSQGELLDSYHEANVLCNFELIWRMPKDEREKHLDSYWIGLTRSDPHRQNFFGELLWQARKEELTKQFAQRLAQFSGPEEEKLEFQRKWNYARTAYSKGSTLDYMGAVLEQMAGKKETDSDTDSDPVGLADIHIEIKDPSPEEQKAAVDVNQGKLIEQEAQHPGSDQGSHKKTIKQIEQVSQESGCCFGGRSFGDWLRSKFQ